MFLVTFSPISLRFQKERGQGLPRSLGLGHSAPRAPSPAGLQTSTCSKVCLLQRLPLLGTPSCLPSQSHLFPWLSPAHPSGLSSRSLPQGESLSSLPSTSHHSTSVLAPGLRSAWFDVTYRFCDYLTKKVFSFSEMVLLICGQLPAVSCGPKILKGKFQKSTTHVLDCTAF